MVHDEARAALLDDLHGGAGVAAILAFADIGITAEWAAFVGVSVATFASLRPLARRLDRGETTEGIGSKRLIGQTGTVLEPIAAGQHELGLVRVHREEWRAESVDGTPIDTGAILLVERDAGTLRATAYSPDVPEGAFVLPG